MLSNSLWFFLLLLLSSHPELQPECQTKFTVKCSLRLLAPSAKKDLVSTPLLFAFPILKCTTCKKRDNNERLRSEALFGKMFLYNRSFLSRCSSNHRFVLSLYLLTHVKLTRPSVFCI